MRREGHVARMRDTRDASRAFVGKPEGKRSLGKPRRRWEDDTKMDLKAIGWGGVDWIHLAQDRGQCRAVVNKAMKPRVGRHGIWLAKWLLASQKGLRSTKLQIFTAEWDENYNYERWNRKEWVGNGRDSTQGSDRHSCKGAEGNNHTLRSVRFPEGEKKSDALPFS